MTRTCRFFHGQNVYLGQRSPIMRIFLFLLFLCYFSSARESICRTARTCRWNAIELNSHERSTWTPLPLRSAAAGDRRRLRRRPNGEHSRLVGVKREHFFSRRAFVGNVVPFLDGHENVVFPIYNTGRLMRKHGD